MSFYAPQFRSLVRRILSAYKVESESAVSLLLGTCAQESGFGTYLRQMGGGPARGVYQMEQLTFDDLKNRFGERFHLNTWHFPEIEWDLEKATMMARIKYLSIPEKLPGPDDIPALARYWKKWYNTPLGVGTEEEFIFNYRKYLS
jgi:hypothetical protein